MNWILKQKRADFFARKLGRMNGPEADTVSGEEKGQEAAASMEKAESQEKPETVKETVMIRCPKCGASVYFLDVYVETLCQERFDQRIPH